MVPGLMIDVSHLKDNHKWVFFLYCVKFSNSLRSVETELYTIHMLYTDICAMKHRVNTVVSRFKSCICKRFKT